MVFILLFLLGISPAPHNGVALLLDNQSLGRNSISKLTDEICAPLLADVSEILRQGD